MASVLGEEVGAVVIGRNEGERLRLCLESLLRQVDRVVYVDSGSTDDSVPLARSLGVRVVELEPTVPFTAARARNLGLEALAERYPELRYVQFVDGDCELESGWIDTGLAAIESAPDVTVVCGRRRERYPQASLYNRLCDMEWDTDIGEAEECGGDALMRIESFRAVGGFSDDLIAGEEPELCARLRLAGGRILRLDAPMTIHDADMKLFRQWWMRAVRAGHAAAEGADRHGRSVGGRNHREVRSVWLWGLVFPIGICGMGIFLGALFALSAAAIYPLQVLRIAYRRPRPRFGRLENLLYAGACVLGKIPNAQGQIRYRLGRLSGRRSALIEYKSAASPPRSDGREVS